MRRHPPGSVVLVTIAAVLLIVGCGGSSQEATDNNATTARADFIKKANAICRRENAAFNAKAASVLRHAAKQPEIVTKRELVKVAVAPTFEKEIEDIRAVQMPPEDKKQVAAILSAMHRAVVQLERNPLSRGPYPYRGVEDLAAGYGLSDCGHP